MLCITTNAGRMPAPVTVKPTEQNTVQRLAIACPSCSQPAGKWCRSPAGRKLPDLHAGRKPGAIPPAAPAQPAAEAANPKETDVPKTSTQDASKPAGSKIQTTTAKTRREPGARPARPQGKEMPKKPDLKATTAGSGSKPKEETKTQLVDRLLHSKIGVTREKLSEATGWPSVNLRVAAGRRPDHVMVENESGHFRLIEKTEFEAFPAEEKKAWTKVKF